MLAVNHIILTQFKNYELSSFSFTENVIGICGQNGKGKTNLLDAIYYLCFTKSYFTSADEANVRMGFEGFRLEADFTQSSQLQKVIGIYRGKGKKELIVNDAAYTKMSEHIGVLPAVMIAPDDISIITGASEARRKYIDTLICQLNTDYLRTLMQYNKLIAQRNSLLKKSNDPSGFDETLLDVLDMQLLHPAKYVFEMRTRLVAQLLPLVDHYYKTLAGGNEEVEMQYQSALQESTMEDLLQKNRKRDKILQRTSAGIHRDDIQFTFQHQPFKNIASQGQRKSLLFALKLAEFIIIKKEKGFSPILLLDDVFEKLDEQRMQQLLNIVCRENQAQVIITDTHVERLRNALTLTDIPFQVIEL